MNTKHYAGLCLSVLLAAPLLAAPTVPGAEARVSQSVVNKQKNPNAALDASGRALLVWENDQLGLQGRFMGRNGQPLGAQFSLVANQVLSGIPAAGDVVSRKDAAAAFLPSGDFVLAWTEEKAFLRLDHFFENRELQDRDVFAQIFDRNGQPAGAPFRVNAEAAGFQSVPRLAARATDVVVVWSSEGRNVGASGVYGRVINRSGLASAELKVADAGAAAAVAAAPNGDFAVVWDAADGSGTGIFAQLYEKDLDAVGSSLRVSTDTVGHQRRPAVAAANDGDYLVVWQGQHGSPRVTRIFGQFVGKAGNLVGSQLALSSGADQKEIAPAVARGQGNTFVAVWLGYDEVFPRGIYGLEIDANGAAVGDAVKLNRRKIDANTRIAIASDAQGFVVPWQGFLQRRHGISVQMLPE
jgi:hypothetical protein